LKIEIKNYSIKLERATGIEPVLPTWESKLSILYFQYLQNRSEKISVHALHTVHALPDLRIAGGRLGDGVALWLPGRFDSNRPVLDDGTILFSVIGQRRSTLSRPRRGH
jgi:hypothetical protein